MSRVWGGTALAQRSNKSPSEAFERPNGLALARWRGLRPDKFYKYFRIVKTQKTSRGCSAHLMGSPFAPNAVPAPVCAAALSGSLTESVRSWRSISFRRLIQDSRCGMKKAGRSADTTFCFFQAQEQHFGVVQSTTKNKFWKIEQLHKILFVKKKNTAHAAQRWILSGESAAK